MLADPRFAPVLPIGADGLAGEDHTQGWRGAPSETRPEGAPLTVILGSKRMPGTEDGAPVLQARARACLARRKADSPHERGLGDCCSWGSPPHLPFSPTGLARLLRGSGSRAARGRLSGAYSAVRGPLQTSTSVADSTRSRERSPSARRSATRIASGHTRDTVTGPFRCAPRGRRLAAAYSWSRKSAVIGSAHMDPACGIHIRTDRCGTRNVGPACTDTI